MFKALYALPEEPQFAPTPAQVVNKLQVDELPEGVSRVFVELVGDGLATGIRVPVLVLRGHSPGPVFGLTACIHGNELNGIPVIHELFGRLDPKQVRGTIVGVVAANVPGLHMYQREFSDGTDLNRIMPGDPGGNVAQVYAHRLLDRIISQFQFLIDLHTASFGRVNSLYVRADMKNETAAAMAYLQKPQIIVHNVIQHSTLRGAAMAMGVPSITVEIGDPQRWQSKYTASALAGVLRVLAFADVIDLSDDDDDGVPEPVLCRASSWMYTDRGGLLAVLPSVTDRLEAGQKVAVLKNAFGDVIREYSSPVDGIVIGRSVNPIGPTGARIVHVGEVVGSEHELLRRSVVVGDQV